MKLVEAGEWRILFVMAVEAEYGPHLRRLFNPLMTGVGPVEAAAATSRALARMESLGELPDLVVSLGSAGSRQLEQAAVYQAASVSYRDMDASALGFPRGVTPFLGEPPRLELPVLLKGYRSVRLSTGANIVSGAAYGEIDAEMVDMETYAVVRAAAGFGAPVVGLRGISDGATDLHHIDNWTEYLHVIDERLALAVEQMLQGLADGSITL